MAEKYQDYKGQYPTLIINGCELFLTCGACPEQYEVFVFGEYLGYLRLRHGYFTASYKGVSGHCVYETNTLGDGIFEEDEREFHLENACRYLLKYHNSRVMKQIRESFYD